MRKKWPNRHVELAVLIFEAQMPGIALLPDLAIDRVERRAGSDPNWDTQLALFS